MLRITKIGVFQSQDFKFKIRNLQRPSFQNLIIPGMDPEKFHPKKILILPYHSSLSLSFSIGEVTRFWIVPKEMCRGIFHMIEAPEPVKAI